MFGLQSRLTWKDLWANSAKERAWHGTGAVSWRWMVSKHTTFLFAWLCSICNLACVGDRGRYSSIVHVLRRAHIARNCGDPHFCGLELLWRLSSKPPPCMHNNYYVCIMHCTLVYAYMKRCGTAVQRGGERTVRTRWRRSGSAVSRLVYLSRLVCRISHCGTRVCPSAGMW